MLAVCPTDTTAQAQRPVDLYAGINTVSLTGDQLNRAFHVKGGLVRERLAALTAYAEREGIIPIAYAAQALVLRMGLVADFLDGPGIDNADWDPTLEALARVRIIDDEDALPIGDSGICFDEVQFEELLAFAHELSW
jgi:hypothetical protein